LWAFALLAPPMPGAGQGSQTQAAMQQAAKQVAGFEFDSFSVSSFHRLRNRSFCLAHGWRAWGGVAEKYK